jgi:hypothetical protein
VRTAGTVPRETQVLLGSCQVGAYIGLCPNLFVGFNLSSKLYATSIYTKHGGAAAYNLGHVESSLMSFC